MPSPEPLDLPPSDFLRLLLLVISLSPCRSSGPGLIRCRLLRGWSITSGGAVFGVEASRAPSTPSLLPGGGGFLCTAFAGSCLWGVKVVLCLVPPKLRLEGVSGDDVVELLSLGLYRWIDRWRWHRGFDCCEVPSWIEAVERVSGAFVWVARVLGFLGLWAYVCVE
ncbi:hypothetical protein F2Q69_00001213 [Brassica cretica]|uniref:Uncharacterized protein n=1 Tax=Brassica cretica TaxID=69181 RepID=A0A8S9NXR4_BRACR|nr:hypothetical protein F2Q69_00001213 [Brassica cretica]